MNFSLFLLFFYFLFINGFHKFYLYKFKKTNLYMSNKYLYSNEYINFYNKFKKPFLLSSSRKESKEMFIEKNIENYKIFEKNLKYINETNAMLEKENNSFSLTVNKYADSVDFDSNTIAADLMNTPIDDTFRPEAYLKIFQSPYPYLETIFNQNIQLTYSWNNTDLLSEVKNQQRCGSCWAFSTTNALETFMRINNFNISRLSEQELVDCSNENNGCDGGLMHLAFDYIKRKGGLSLDEKYPYVAKNQNCSSKGLPKAHGSHLSEYHFTIPKSLTDMKLNVVRTPISIALDANNIFFRFYREGVIDINQNRNGTLNHAVLLVGFDYDEKGMYWVIQNSWGKDWGDNGFCKIRAIPGEGILLCQLYGVYPTKIYDSSNDRLNYSI